MSGIRRFVMKIVYVFVGFVYRAVCSCSYQYIIKLRNGIWLLLLLLLSACVY